MSQRMKLQSTILKREILHHLSDDRFVVGQCVNCRDGSKFTVKPKLPVPLWQLTLRRGKAVTQRRDKLCLLFSWYLTSLSATEHWISSTMLSWYEAQCTKEWSAFSCAACMQQFCRSGGVSHFRGACNQQAAGQRTLAPFCSAYRCITCYDK